MMNKINKPLTYISLFSSAGVGCFGFKTEDFQCIATNELEDKRLNIQKFNNKCKYDSGYIVGDITIPEIKNQLFSQVDMWKRTEKLNTVDIVIATPPCQGMSVANQKKTDTNMKRNSLVIEAIKIIQEIKPNFFIFENVPAFMNTICTDIDNLDKPISEAIYNNLGSMYSYIYRTINFKDYGAASSRTRTLVIGISKNLSNDISPYELMPNISIEKTLRDTIGKYKPLYTMGEIDNNDIYHFFRKYPEGMRSWISDLLQGQSAFENTCDSKKPHQIIDGKIIPNKQNAKDKYKRQFWDKVAPCIHTRNDSLASQNTVHPSDDRVFSISEIMEMMTIPSNFKWSPIDINTLNNYTIPDKQNFLKQNELNIRRCLGEAVPTAIFSSIAKKIKAFLQSNTLKLAEINKLIKEYNLSEHKTLLTFIKENRLNLSLSTLSKIAELSNSFRTDNAAFFTSKALITEILKDLPEPKSDTITILEPSVGVGNFIPLILKRFEYVNVQIDVIDIDELSIDILKILIEKYDLPSNFTINYITSDFLLHQFNKKYDYIIGNPPFYKLKNNNKLLDIYTKNAINKTTTNICSFFLDKSISLGNNVFLVLPKFILNTPEFKETRDYLEDKNIISIIDFGENGFPGVLVETIAILVNTTSRAKNSVNNKNRQVKVKSYTKNIVMYQKTNYIFDNSFPYWIIYRNNQFDYVYNQLEFGCFKVFRDRQIVNKYLSSSGDIRVLKSRNISDDGKHIINIEDYDAYINDITASSLSVNKYLNNDNVYLTPNMTYKPRVMKKPKNTLVNGSLAILIPIKDDKITERQLHYFSSNEYRSFYQIARNYQTRSLNVDSCSVFFYGLLKDNTCTSSNINLPSQLSLFDSTEGDV